MDKKKVTIHKKNELVRGTDRYSINAKRALNTIYYGIQKNNLFKYPRFQIRFSTLRELMNLEKDNRYVETIKNALRELREPLELNNFTHPTTGDKYSWYSLSFLNEVGFKKQDKELFAEVEMNQTMLKLMQIKDNFTKLDLMQYLNKFRTKYAMKLYEYLKSFERYKYLDITDEHMRKLLAIENIKKYQYFSTLKELIERQIKEIQSKSDLKELKYRPYKTNKTFKFYINPKATKKEPDQQEIEEVLEKIIRRF